MRHIDPRPLEEKTSRHRAPWAGAKAIKIGETLPISTMLLFEALEQRRTLRVLRKATLKEVCRALCAAACVRSVKHDDKLMRSRRPSVAAGAIHAIEVFIVHGTMSKQIFYFDPFERTISSVSNMDHLRLQAFWERCVSVVPSAVSTLIVLVGRPDVLSLAYENVESLLWRDAGALLQTLSMTAYGLGMGFCPLGLLGQDFLKCIPYSDETLCAVGTGWLGLAKQ